ncbi:PspC domain-containing protein [Aeromicrobium sp. Root495]|uniref:PspC domain-containing protein n=1 Tax=Aeromicrobium sp. Root495 TaxID=1736550 RepID=UPI0009EC3633|nr:PspC domain-containing protein [Aeromicrobium sp. Root495]RYJ06864.1 MAG: PspC domain-containing protein [Actinomycetales bacterium]
MSSTPGTPKKLVRSRDDKWLSGVCGGLAEYTGVDVTLIRIVVLVGTVIGFGSLLVAYVVAWILMPAVERPQPPVVIQQPAPQPGTPPEPPTPSA